MPTWTVSLRRTALCGLLTAMLFAGRSSVAANEPAPYVEPVDQANAVYQFGVELTNPIGDPLFAGKTAAFLWVPPHAAHLRAVLLAPANIIERRVTDSPIIRAEAERDGIALVFFQAGWGKGGMDAPGVATFVQTMLNALADQSGYAELKTVPWIPIGHSGNSGFVRTIAHLKPERILTSVVIKGGLPEVGKDGSTVGVAGIPTLFFTGEFEEVMPPGHVRNGWWAVSMQRFLGVRKLVPDALYSGMEDKDHGHIHWMPPMQSYLAMWIHKAAAARLSDESNALKPVAFASGWLGDPEEKVSVAPVAEYKGDATKAFWFFDREQAEAWHKLFTHDEGKKEQLIAFEQNGAITPLWAGWGLQTIQFQPMADGVTFQVKARFRDEVPEPFADAHTKLGHASSGAFTYQVVGWAGATEHIGPDTFRLRFDREGFNGRTTHILIGAIHPGDAEYRETVAVATFDVAATTGGLKQTITFPKIANVKAGTASVPLKATSDAGLPVQYYVSWGPARVVGSSLVFTELPDHAQYPIAVRVTAYQWGKGTQPMVNTATPMTQTFYLRK